MADALSFPCRACGEPVDAVPFTAVEMLLETREAFQYVECSACGTLQIVEIPADLGRFYPDEYRLPKTAGAGLAGRTLRRIRGSYVRGAHWNVPGWLLMKMKRPPWIDWMLGTHARTDSRILDVGTARGELLLALSAAGYRDLTGIDPFIEPATNLPEGVRIYQHTIEDEQGPYDVIMLHHSLEHVPDPAAVMRHVRRLLAPGGWALVRMPLAGSYGWRTYREHWLGLDPPRHICVPTREGMARLADQAGMQVKSTAYDSSGCCYAESEIWASGRVFPYPRHPWEQFTTEMLGAERVAEFQRISRERNAAGDGDHAAYYLQASDN